MKTTHLLKIPKGLALVGAVMLPHQNAAAVAIVNLGTASNFAILAGSEITDVQGPVGGTSTIVAGDAGVYPGTSNGLTASQVVGGAIYSRPGDDGLLLQAQNDLTTAYVDAGGRSVPGANAYGDTDNQLGGKILFPGVYSFGHAATANLIGTLTLDANGDLNPIWIFLASSDLIVQSDSTVALQNGATSCDVFWWVGSSATIGTYTDFVGTIMADQSIALQTGATLKGAALARIAAVTLDHNTIDRSPCTPGGGGDDGGGGGDDGGGGGDDGGGGGDDGGGGGDDGGGGIGVPDSGSSLPLLGSGLAMLMVLKRRFFTSACK